LRATGGGQHGVGQAEGAGAQGVTRPQHIRALVATAELRGDRRQAQRERHRDQRRGDQPHPPAVGRGLALGGPARHLSPGPDEHRRRREHQHHRVRGEPAEHRHGGRQQADQREQADQDQDQGLERPRAAASTRPAAQQRGGQGEDDDEDQHRARG
jgi:hypothetical protein